MLTRAVVSVIMHDKVSFSLLPLKSYREATAIRISEPNLHSPLSYSGPVWPQPDSYLPSRHSYANFIKPAARDYSAHASGKGNQKELKGNQRRSKESKGNQRKSKESKGNQRIPKGNQKEIQRKSKEIKGSQGQIKESKGKQRNSKERKGMRRGSRGFDY